MSSLITAILYFLKDIAAVAALFFLFRYVFRDEFSFGKIRTVLLIVIYAAIAFGGNLYLARLIDGYDELLDFISNIMYIITALMIDKNKKPGRIILCIFLCVCTADMLYSLISSFLPSGLITEYSVNIVIYLITTVLLFLSGKKSVINPLPAVFNEIPKWIYGVILFFELTCYYKEFGISSDWYRVLYTVSSALVILGFVFLVFKVFSMAHRQARILESLAAQKEYAENSAGNDDELRRFRHDFKNHMIIVSAFLENGKTDEARNYIDSVSGNISRAVSNIETGNFVADTILNTKAASVSDENIEFDFTGFIPPSGIRDEDLSVILSNLIDNAVEACRKTEGKRIIETEANITGIFFVLSVSNTVNESEFSPSLSTTKSDKRNHGIGIRNIKRVISRYDGIFVTDVRDGIFTADIRLKLNKN